MRCAKSTQSLWRSVCNYRGVTIEVVVSFCLSFCRSVCRSVCPSVVLPNVEFKAMLLLFFSQHFQRFFELFFFTTLVATFSDTLIFGQVKGSFCLSLGRSVVHMKNLTIPSPTRKISTLKKLKNWKNNYVEKSRHSQKEQLEKTTCKRSFSDFSG